MKKQIGKIVTKDIATINGELKKNAFSDNIENRINKFLYGLRSYLNDDYIVKKISSYAIEGIFSFEGTPTVDLLVIKYLNRDFYKRYDDEINTENHYLDCLCCFHKKCIFKKLEYLFETK